MNGRTHQMSYGHQGLLMNIAMGLVVLSIVLLVLPQSRNTIYETDEAALLAGSISLSRGADWVHGDFYNYDRQFVSYWVHALLFRAATRLGHVDPVTLANDTTALFFWISLLAFLCKSRLSGQRLGFLSGVLLAPCLLLHSPFATTAFLSGSFLLVLATTMRSHGGNGKALLCFFLSFCATGARADAILLIPWLLWLNTSRRHLGGLWSSPTVWLTSLGAVTAVLTGRILYVGVPFYFDVFIFKPALFIAYLVFGLGGGLIVWGSHLAAMAASLRAPSLRSRAFQGVGLGFFALPAGYYFLQLYSTRYLLLTVLASLVFLQSRRGWAIMRSMFPKPTLTWMATVTLVLAVVPLAVGIHLPRRNTPRITFTQPTTFPTMDGHVSMGAYLPFLLNRWNPDRGMFDHNRPLWRVAQNARFDLPATGPIPVLNTPMYWFVAYAVLRQNRTPVPVEPASSVSNTLVYADSRSLMRAWIGVHGADYGEDTFSALLQTHVETVSPDDMGLCIVRITPGPPTETGTVWQTARKQFAGDDFRVMDGLTSREAEAHLQKLRESGRRVIVMAREAFCVSTVHPPSDQQDLWQSSLVDGYHSVFISTQSHPGKPLTLLAKNPGLLYKVLFSTLPEYMSIRRFLN